MNEVAIIDAVSMRQIERIIERHKRIRELLAKHNFDEADVLCEENLFDEDDLTEVAELVHAISEQMRGIKDEFKHLDFVFSRERDCTAQQIEFIVASYAAAFQIRAECFELAARRYRKGEHRFTTCRHMHISESQYYKLLGKFLSIAKAVHERLTTE